MMAIPAQGKGSERVFRSLKTQTSFCDSVTAEVLQEHPHKDNTLSKSFLILLSTAFFPVHLIFRFPVPNDSFSHLIIQL